MVAAALDEFVPFHMSSSSSAGLYAGLGAVGRREDCRTGLGDGSALAPCSDCFTLFCRGFFEGGMARALPDALPACGALCTRLRRGAGVRVRFLTVLDARSAFDLRERVFCVGVGKGS